MALEHPVTHPTPTGRAVWHWSEGKQREVHHSFIHWFYKYLLSTYNVPGTVQGTEDELVYKIDEAI